MNPRETFELMIVGFVIATIVIISLFLKGKSRKIGWSLALITFLAYSIFYVAHPFWIDAQIDNKVNLLKPYLVQHYPDEKWVISTVPHREKGFKHLNPYYIGVVFKSEPEVRYYYWVESKSNIYQTGSTNKGYVELKHLEKNTNN